MSDSLSTIYLEQQQQKKTVQITGMWEVWKEIINQCDLLHIPSTAAQPSAAVLTYSSVGQSASFSEPPLYTAPPAQATNQTRCEHG